MKYNRCFKYWDKIKLDKKKLKRECKNARLWYLTLTISCLHSYQEQEQPIYSVRYNPKSNIKDLITSQRKLQDFIRSPKRKHFMQTGVPTLGKRKINRRSRKGRFSKRSHETLDNTFGCNLQQFQLHKSAIIQLT